MEKSERTMIYLVDDNRANLMIIKQKLRKHLNCKVRTFQTAEECLQIVDWRTPDLVLADYNLDALYSHQMNGDRMLARIKKKHPSVPVIMYSSIKSIDLTANLMKQGAVDFIPRDDRFLGRITDAASGQINRITERYRGRKVRAIFLLLLISLVGGLVTVSYMQSDWLPYYVLGVFFLAIAGTLVIPFASGPAVKERTSS